MENIDATYKTELNFVEEFTLTRNGMIKEIKTEFNIIRLCISELLELDEEYERILDRVIVMPLRKLLCENNSVLLKVCPDFKMPKLQGYVCEIGGSQTAVRPPYMIENMQNWISVSDWLQQPISWYDRTVDTMSDMIPKYVYECISRRLNDRNYRARKQEFESKFYCRQVEYRGQVTDIYSRKNPQDEDSNKAIFEILEMIGYNKLNIYTFLKHISDKRGAHVDAGHSLIVEMINMADTNKMTPIHYFAIQMIYAAKKQIPELNDYWPNMPELQV